MASSQPNYFFIFSSTDPTIINTEPVLIPGSTSSTDLYNYLRGLIVCWSVYNSSLVAIYNPTTRQSLYLPELTPLNKHARICLFGYDPIEDHYKVLYILELGEELAWHVFTLRGPKTWRKIKGPRLYWPLLPTVCINGVIYFRATTNNKKYVLMSFDVKSEKFDQVQAPNLMIRRSILIDYQGKLGFLCRQMGMEIWIMEDVEKQEWSKIFFYEMKGFETWSLSGVNRGGEIVFHNRSKVLYYDPKRNYMRCVETNDTSLVDLVVPDHVENTMSLN